MDVEEQIEHLEREVHNQLFIIIYVDNYLLIYVDNYLQNLYHHLRR